MAKQHIYIEQRPKMGDYAVRPRGEQIPTFTAPTQKLAIEISKVLYPGSRPDVERVRNTSRGSRDKWRSA